MVMIASADPQSVGIVISIVSIVGDAGAVNVTVGLVTGQEPSAAFLTNTK